MTARRARVERATLGTAIVALDHVAGAVPGPPARAGSTSSDASRIGPGGRTGNHPSLAALEEIAR